MLRFRRALSRVSPYHGPRYYLRWLHSDVHPRWQLPVLRRTPLALTSALPTRTHLGGMHTAAKMNSVSAPH